MKKYSALIITVVILAGGAYYTQQYFIESSASNTAAVTATIAEQSAPVQQTASVAISGSADTPKISATQSPTQTPNVTLSIPDASYDVYTSLGTTVLETMRMLASTTDFTFSGRDYPSLGFFVDSINGKKGESGHYWILYINGTSSNTGASETHLKAGDRVEWRYQKGY